MRQPADTQDTRTVILLSLMIAMLMSAVTAGLVWPSRALVLTGANDFLSFYAGARLVGTSGLYDIDTVRRVQMESAGTESETLPYTRPPFHAAALWPLGLLPYSAAYLVWQILNLAALAGFVALWPFTRWPVTLLLTCGAMAIYWSFANAQDLPFLLLWIGLAMRLHVRNQNFAAGGVFALCAAKYHLFVLLPLLLVRREHRRFGAGLLTVGAALVAVSFAVQGIGWPAENLRALMEGSIHGEFGHSPNLYGLLPPASVGPYVVGFFIILIVASAWLVIAQTGFAHGMSAALTASLLIAPHSFVQDTALLLPAALILSAASSSRVVSGLAWFILTPIPYLLGLTLPAPWARLLPAVMLLLLIAMAVESRHHPAAKQ